MSSTSIAGSSLIDSVKMSSRSTALQSVLPHMMLEPCKRA
jgi:hypothetical protein